jgi:hypothetical protein
MRAIALTILLLAAYALAGAQVNQDKLAIYGEWNKCVTTLEAEGDFDTGLWARLRASLVGDPPEFVKSLDRIAIYDELIALHEKRIAALKKMRALEK